ncbi:MAG: discoidin domain-containing protein [Mycobacteriales bacterium]
MPLPRLVPLTCAMLLGITTGITTGCAMSKVPRHAAVRVHGRLLTASGRPVAHRDVALARVPDPLELLTQGIVVAGTVGVPCLSKNPPPICRLLRRTSTDGKGGYAFAMDGEAVRGSIGEASPFQLSAALPARHGQVTGPVIETSFLVQRADLTLPDLAFWEPSGLAVESGRQAVRVRWDAYRAPAGWRANPSTVEVTAGSGRVWSQRLAPGGTFDARAVEDVRGAAYVAAHADRKGPDTTFQTTFASPRLRFTGAAGRPESRGRPCLLPDGTARRCAATDGAFDRPLTAAPCPTSQCPPLTWVAVDLGAARPVSAVFAHGLALTTGRAVVSTSDDAVAWTPRATVAVTDFLRVPLPAGITARYVRLAAADGTTPIAALTELSVWP